MLLINRNKVTEINNELSREKIKNIKVIQNIENKYEHIIQEKHEEIATLKTELRQPQNPKTPFVHVICQIKKKNNHIFNGARQGNGETSLRNRQGRRSRCTYLEISLETS